MPDWRTPGSGSQPVRVGPAVEPRGVALRFPVVEQVATQLGWALARDARQLTPRELEIARPIFRGSIIYDAVRVVRASVANAPTTLGNYVRVAPGARLDDATLVHELTHVWQYQTHGTGYISNSLCAQVAGMIGSGTRNAAYEIRPDQLFNVRTFYDLSAERQARITEFYLVATRLVDSDPAVVANTRQEFWYLVQEMADPTTDRAQFDAEFAELERMIGEVRRGQPMSRIEIYEESLYGPAMHSPLRDMFNSPDGQPMLHPMPIIRLEF